VKRLTSVLATLGLLASSAHAATVSMVPASSTIGLGEEVTLAVTTSADFGNAYGGALGLVFDTSVLAFKSATAGAPWYVDPKVPSDSVERVDVVLDLIFGAAVRTGPFLAFNLTFEAVGLGTTQVQLYDDQVFDPNAPLDDFFFFGWIPSESNLTPRVGINYESAEVQVVPLPAAAWLMLGGLGLFPAALRRKARR